MAIAFVRVYELADDGDVVREVIISRPEVVEVRYPKKPKEGFDFIELKIKSRTADIYRIEVSNKQKLFDVETLVRKIAMGQNVYIAAKSIDDTDAFMGSED